MPIILPAVLGTGKKRDPSLHRRRGEQKTLKLQWNNEPSFKVFLVKFHFRDESKVETFHTKWAAIKVEINTALQL